MKRVLILSAHVDDAEIGMGGHIAKLAESPYEYEIQMHALSGADKSLSKEFEKGTLAKEAQNAAFMLGLIEKDQHTTWNFETREFPRDRQRVLDLMIQLRGWNPDIIFCPNYDDMHQDHAVLAQEAMRAFKHKTLLMYQLPWNSRVIKMQYFSVLYERHVSKKTSALKQFESQAKKRYMRATSIIAQLRTFGLVADVEYAEPFEVVRYIDG